MSGGLDRRGWLRGLLASAGGLVLASCDKVVQAPAVRGVLGRTETLTKAAQRLFQHRTALAREFTRADLSPKFKANGSVNPGDPEYQAHVAAAFEDWALVVDGLVERPLKLTLAELRALPSRTQITRHDCVEGWSCIGEWSGARLGPLLEKAGLKPSAKYVVFHCADTLGPATDGSDRYYESIDLVDAFHPQTILAYDMNGAPLTVPHGAPVRLRVERQLGYKQAKYVMRIEAVDSFAHMGKGKGGFWPDRGYEWYAGI